MAGSAVRDRPQRPAVSALARGISAAVLDCTVPGAGGSHAGSQLGTALQAAPMRWQPKNPSKQPFRGGGVVPGPRAPPRSPVLGPGAGVLLPRAQWLQRSPTTGPLPRYPG